MMTTKACQTAVRRGATLGLVLASACGGMVGNYGPPDDKQGVATAESVVGSWVLSELKEAGRQVTLVPQYSYNWTPTHAELELNYLVFAKAENDESLPTKGQFYRWSFQSEVAVDGRGGCALSFVDMAEYPPFELLEPLAADFCPDACSAARDAFERVVLSVTHCEISNGALTLANEDRSNSLVLSASDYDLSGILH